MLQATTHRHVVAITKSNGATSAIYLLMSKLSQAICGFDCVVRSTTNDPFSTFSFLYSTNLRE